MANYATLKAAIAAVIKENGNNEITGNLLQQSLLAMVDSLGVGYQYVGIASPATNPGIPDQNVFYLASTAGTYVNFSGLVLANGEIAILKYNGAWSKDSTGAASLEKLNQLGQQPAYITMSSIFTFAIEPIANGIKIVQETVGNIYIYLRGVYATIASTQINGREVLNDHFLAFKISDNSLVDFTSRPNSSDYIVLAVANTGRLVGGLLLPFWQENRFSNLEGTNGAFLTMEYPDRLSVTEISGGINIMASGGIYVYAGSSYITLNGINKELLNDHIFALKISDGTLHDFTGKPSSEYVILAVANKGRLVGGLFYPIYQNNLSQAIGDLTELDTINKNDLVASINEVNARFSGYIPAPIIRNSYVTTGGVITAFNGWDRTNYVQIGNYEKVRIVITSSPVNYVYNAWYDKNHAFIGNLTLTGEDAEYNVPTGAEYLIISNQRQSISTLSIYGIGESALKDTDILSLNPRSQYDCPIIQMSGKYGNGRISGILPPIVLAWFSDVHGDGVNISRLNEFCERYKTRISNILSSGDNIPSHFEDSYDFWVNNGGGPVITALGNHDAWTDDNDPDIVEGGYQGESLFLVKPKLCYDKFYAPFISDWGVTQPQDAATLGKCYFYKDYTFTEGGVSSTIMRMIVLDCMHYNIYSDLVNGVSVQNTWLISTLEDARTNGIPVLIVSHYKGDNINYLDCPWSSRDYSSEDRTPLAKSAVKDFLDAGGELICWLNGHDHFDIIGTFVSDPRQLQIGIETAKCPDTWGDSERVSGTKTQDCFNLIAFDTRDKLIKIVRIGDDYNRGLYHKGRLVYRYKTIDSEHQQGLILCE